MTEVFLSELHRTCEELRAALGEACAIGNQVYGAHPRLEELKAMHAISSTDANRQLLLAQQAQARAYRRADWLRAEIERSGAR